MRWWWTNLFHSANQTKKKIGNEKMINHPISLNQTCYLVLKFVYRWQQYVNLKNNQTLMGLVCIILLSNRHISSNYACPPIASIHQGGTLFFFLGYYCHWRNYWSFISMSRVQGSGYPDELPWADGVLWKRKSSPLAPLQFCFARRVMHCHSVSFDLLEYTYLIHCFAKNNIIIML